MTKLYSLAPRVLTYVPVGLREHRKIFMRHFIGRRDADPEELEKAGTLTFKAEAGQYLKDDYKGDPSDAMVRDVVLDYQVDYFHNTDFVSADFQLPVFSETAHGLLRDALADDVEFSPCIIRCQGEELKFFAGKLVSERPIVDTEKSTYRTLMDGSKTLAGTVYRDDLDCDFYLARDTGRNYRIAASQKLADLISRLDLKMRVELLPTDFSDL